MNLAAVGFITCSHPKILELCPWIPLPKRNLTVCAGVDVTGLWSSGERNGLVEQPSNCSWTEDGPAPPKGRQQSSGWPRSSYPLRLVPGCYSPVAQVCPLPSAPHRIVFLKLTRMLANQPPENSFCQNLREHVAEIKQLFARVSGAGEVSRRLTAMGEELLGRGGISTFHAHFFTSWAELFPSSGCVARRGVLCPPYGYE